MFSILLFFLTLVSAHAACSLSLEGEPERGYEGISLAGQWDISFPNRETSPLALSEQSERFGERGRGKGAAIIDTPGIKGFGGIEMDKYEVSHYFREIFRIGRECRFDNCMHTGEPGCAVQEAVVDGRIAISRFESYISLLGDIRESKYR